MSAPETAPSAPGTHLAHLTPEMSAAIDRTVAALPPLPNEMRQWLGRMLGGGPAGPAPVYRAATTNGGDA